MTEGRGQATGLRSPPLPIEHLVAELLAAPFSSFQAFAASLVALNPNLPPVMVPLWRQVERDLLSRFPGMSVDELVVRRDHLWFAGTSRQGRPIPLEEVLRRFTHDLIATDGGVARLCGTTERLDSESRRSWRWLTFSLPPDLLLAAAGASCEAMQVLSAKLRVQLADSGVSEPHLHLKAAITFPGLWASLMRAIADPKVKESMLVSPGADFDEGKKLAPLLLACAVSRLLLSVFLRQSPLTKVSSFLEKQAAPRIGRWLGAAARLAVQRAILSLAAGDVQSLGPFHVLRDVYAQMIGPLRADQVVANLDPLFWAFPPSKITHPDFSFTRAALAHMRSVDDPLFARIFWQTVRGRVFFYRHVVQRPMVPGLQWFARAYARISSPRKPVPLEAFVQQAADLSGPGLRALEVRVTPEDRFHELVDLVRTVDVAAKSLAGPPPARVSRSWSVSPATALSGRTRSAKPVREQDGLVPEVGLIFHFSRSRGPDAVAGRPAAWSRGNHDDPEASHLNPSGYRYSGYFREQRTRATALANLLVAYPRMLERVRGIDLCTDELSIPLWVLRPLVNHVLLAGRRAGAYLNKRAGCRGEPLRVTVHAGEDYVHLIGGIRRVDEAVTLLNLGEGSRIGHAVALGVDVREWATRTSRLVLPIGERLLDLFWVWQVARRAPEELHCWLPWIDQEITRLSEELFGRPLIPALLEKWWGGMHNFTTLRAAGFPDGPRPRQRSLGKLVESGPSSADLVHQWLTDRALFKRAQKVEVIDVEREIPLVATLQAYARRVIGSRGITIEMNPSSNLLIGHLGDLVSHPLWRLCPPSGIAADAPAVRVCIGSDDPITFATSLPEEYQLLADALASAGVSAPVVDEWLDAARQCAIATRFTVPRSGAELTLPICAEMYPAPR